MLTVTPTRLRKRPPRNALPASPVLIGGSFQDEDEQLLTLTFDRAVAVTGSFDPAVLLVNDPRSGESYRGAGAATVLNPTTIRVGVTPASLSSGTRTLLTAGPSSGIVAAGTGAAWAGVGGFVLSTPS